MIALTTGDKVIIVIEIKLPERYSVYKEVSGLQASYPNIRTVNSWKTEGC